MSKVVSAMNGASFAGLTHVSDAGLQGMITLRGDLTSAALKAAVKAIVGTDVPDQRRILSSELGAAAWMSPDELLLLVPYKDAVAKTAELADLLKGEHALAVNVSDARAFFKLEGEGSREVLAKIAPVDLEPASFEAGDFRRSRLAQVAAAFWLEEDGCFYIVCFRSVGAYMFNLLKTSAHPQAKVGIYQG